MESYKGGMRRVEGGQKFMRISEHNRGLKINGEGARGVGGRGCRLMRMGEN